MSKTVKVTRHFKITDAEMIQFSRVMLTQFERDKLRFSQSDTCFNDPFCDDWLDAIQSAESAEQDGAVQNEMARLTGIVDEKMEACRIHFQGMKYYIEKAFPNNSAVCSAFGYGKYDGARLSEIKLLLFMKSLHAEAVKNKVALINAGFNQAKIDMIETLHGELMAANQEHAAYKQNRPVFTQNRIMELNAAWDFFSRVNKASKIVFADNYAKFRQYQLPWESSAPEKEN